MTLKDIPIRGFDTSIKMGFTSCMTKEGNMTNNPTYTNKIKEYKLSGLMYINSDQIDNFIEMYEPPCSFGQISNASP